MSQLISTILLDRQLYYVWHYSMFYFHYSLFAHLVVPLLQRHGQGREPVLGGEGLAGARGQQEPHHVVMVLLGRHVQRGEPILGLDIHTRAGIENSVTHERLRSLGLVRGYL